MVIYEVNLTISNDIFAEYYDWLIKHVEEMLQFRGFQRAEIANEKQAENEVVGAKKLTVRYTLESEQHLQDYLAQHACIMREDALKRFGNKFSALRRIFIEEK